MSVKSQGKRARSVSVMEDETHDEQYGEAFVTASVGSNENVDFLGENLMRNREAMETGYIGQNSEIQWLRSVQRQSESGNTDPHGQRFGPPGTSRHAANQRSAALHERRQHARPGSMGHVSKFAFKHLGILNTDLFSSLLDLQPMQHSTWIATTSTWTLLSTHTRCQIQILENGSSIAMWRRCMARSL